jgi:hypothetical protein
MKTYNSSHECAHVESGACYHCKHPMKPRYINDQTESGKKLNEQFQLLKNELGL